MWAHIAVIVYFYKFIFLYFFLSIVKSYHRQLEYLFLNRFEIACHIFYINHNKMLTLKTKHLNNL